MSIYSLHYTMCEFFIITFLSIYCHFTPASWQNI